MNKRRILVSEGKFGHERARGWRTFSDTIADVLLFEGPLRPLGSGFEVAPICTCAFQVLRQESAAARGGADERTRGAESPRAAAQSGRGGDGVPSLGHLCLVRLLCACKHDAGRSVPCMLSRCYIAINLLIKMERNSKQIRCRFVDNFRSGNRPFGLALLPRVPRCLPGRLQTP